MPAKIHIIAGVRAGSVVWIDKPVLRIGSHPDVDVCVPSVEIAEHVATLEFRDGAYAVYNRTNESLRIDGEDIAPGSSGSWRHGTQLDLGDDTVLQLELTGDGSPSAKPSAPAYEVNGIDEAVYRDDAEDAEGAATADAPAESTHLKTAGQLVVILLSFLAIGGMLYNEFLKPKSSASSTNALDVGNVLDALEDAIKDSTGEDRTQLEFLRRQLRGAEFARMRGNTEESRSQFEALRAELKRRRDVAGKSPSEGESKLLRYVLTRLNEG